MRLSTIALLLLIAACSSRAKPTKQGKWPEGVSPMTVHNKIDHKVRMSNFDMGRMDDGRMHIKVVIENRSKKDIPVIAYTDWMDRDGNVIERSNDIPIVLPSGTTKVYEDSSWSARAELFSVSVRPANTKRRTK
ncbi:MAG: hypothetical protein ACYTHK_04330 [Planctomycetota bacterium]|jgi:hypothetical protein